MKSFFLQFSVRLAGTVIKKNKLLTIILSHWNSFIQIFLQRLNSADYFLIVHTEQNYFEIKYHLMYK